MRFTSTANLWRAQERWLEFHDRKTGDVPGILPLVLDMPIRFTKAINTKAREMGVFKHTRGFFARMGTDGGRASAPPGIPGPRGRAEAAAAAFSH